MTASGPAPASPLGPDGGLPIVPTRRPRRKPSRGESWTVHLARLSVVAAIAALLSGIYARRQAERRTEVLTRVSPSVLAELFGGPVTVGGLGSRGGRRVLAADGRTAGEILQTAPASDRYLGFSGPTNLLVAVAADDTLRGVAVLQSGDTRDHVDLIERDGRFLRSWRGHPVSDGEPPRPDAVSGATLTSLAIAQGLSARLGEVRDGPAPEHPTTTPTWPGDPDLGGKFVLPPPSEVVRALAPDATTLVPGPAVGAWHREGGDSGTPARWLGTSPAGDQTIGYQGPTEAYLALDADDRVTGLTLGRSYDNEPYVGYVREDEYFREAFVGKTVDELATLELDAAGVEGVSGATMTSLAVAKAITVAAAAHAGASGTPASTDRAPGPHRGGAEVSGGDDPPSGSAARRAVQGLVVGLTLAGVGLAFSRLRGRRWVRAGFQVAVILGLGVAAGTLLSQAQLVGWARHGLPWATATGLVVLTAAALILPTLAGRNVYCDHLCPHGAVQQLLLRVPAPRPKLPAWLTRSLAVIRPALLVWVVLWAALPALESSGVSLADVEPFDAWSFRAARWPSLAIAVVGLVASLFVPMAYCRHGCPTGLVLDIVRRHGRSGELTGTDALLLGILALTAVLAFLACT